MMMTTETTPIILRADQEHSGIRTAVFLSLFLILILLFILIRTIWGTLSPAGLPDFSFIVTCLLSLIFGLAAVYLLEQLLKKYWSSGRRLILDEATIHTENKVEESVIIKWAHTPAQQSWWFYLKGFQRGGRERRLPKDWVCVATQLQEADKRIIVFAYLPPKKVTQWTEQEPFQQIIPAEVYKSGVSSRLNLPSRPPIAASVLAGKDGRYWQAERNRWTDGYELTGKDFETFMDFVTSH